MRSSTHAARRRQQPRARRRRRGHHNVIPASQPAPARADRAREAPRGPTAGRVRRRSIMAEEVKSALETPRAAALRASGGACTNAHSRTAKPVGATVSLLFVGLVVYELAFFEWDDWRADGSPPGAFGFTGPALLWSLCTLWSLSQVFFCALHVFSAQFRGFQHQHQVKVVKYCVQITWGSVFAALYLTFQLYMDAILSSACTEAPDPSVACALQWSWPWSHTVTLFASMYIWELVHEGVMIHGSLATHHCCIVLLWQVAIGYYASRDWIRPEQLHAISDTGFAQLLCAGLEQPTFVALLLHRFGASLAVKSRAFQVAWISFAVTKAAALIYTVIALVVNWAVAPMFWNVLMVVSTAGLSVTQVWSTAVLRKLSKRMTSQLVSSLRGGVEMA
jgi:hypothetical protein